jgi:transposase-like protein
LAVQDLALAEANDAVEYRDDGIDETTQEDRPESVREGEGEATPEIVAPAAVGPSAAPDLLSKVGDGRIANFGCPYCGGYEVGRWGRANGRPRYRCKECRKTFGPLTGTPLAGLHYKDRWMDQAQALMSGESVVKAAERCAINRTTAFRWRHRFLSALNLDKPTSLSGIVEADETFVLESFKGKRNRSWNSLAPERRTPEAMDIMAAVIVHLATQGERDPVQLSTQALQTAIREAPRGAL